MRIACLVLFLFMLHQLQGQTNFIPGFVITNENDTLHGWINYRSDARNAKKCEFKDHEKAPVQEFLPSSIKAYRFNDHKFYVSRNVLSEGKEIPVFLEFLVNGISDLYYYSNSNGPHYLIEKEGQLVELTDRVHYVDNNGKEYTTKSKKYIGQLKIAFADCQALYPIINKARLDDKSLMEVTRQYHQYVCEGDKCIIYEKKLPVIKLRAGAFASLNGSMLAFKEHPTYQNMDFNKAVYPTAGLLLNTSLPRISEKLSIELSGEYGQAYFYGTDIHPAKTDFEEVHLHLDMIKAKAGIKYTYPKGKLRPTVLVGGNLIKPIKPDGRRIVNDLVESTVDTYILRDVPFPSSLLGASMALGIDYQPRSSWTSYVKLGYDYSVGYMGVISTWTPSSILKTINLHAGINF